jgi:serine phosphatase RsbU (regulator of sigma subunit)
VLAKKASTLFYFNRAQSAEMYEDEQLESFVLKNQDKPAQQFVDDLIENVSKFVGHAEQSDDRTVLYLRRNL